MDEKEIKHVKSQFQKDGEKPKKNIEISDKNQRIFELYIAYCFSRELECENFSQGKKYSLFNEIMRIEEIIKNQKDIATEENNKIKENLIRYIEKINSFMTCYKDFSKFSRENETRSQKNIEQSSSDNIKTNKKII